MSNSDRPGVSNVRPLSPAVEKQILGAFTSTLTAAEAKELLDDPEPGAYRTPVDDLRWLLCSMVDTVANLHRAVMACERKGVRAVILPSDLEEANLSADLLTVFALELRDAVKAIRVERASPRRSCQYKMEAEPVNAPDMAGVMAFAAKISVDLRDEDRDGFPGALSANLPPDLMEALTLEDLDDEPDAYLPTPEEIWQTAAKLRGVRTQPTGGRDDE